MDIIQHFPGSWLYYTYLYLSEKGIHIVWYTDYARILLGSFVSTGLIQGDTHEVRLLS
jgi:hypothetical protein